MYYPKIYHPKTAEESKNYNIRFDESIEDLIFLGVFYRNIINPINGTINFSKHVKNAGAEDVKIGNTNMNSDSPKMILIVNDFESLLYKFNIPIECLKYSELNDFFYNLQKHWDNHECTKKL